MMRKKYSRWRKGIISAFTAVSLALSGIGYSGLNSALTIAKADTTERIVDSASAVNYSSILGRAVDYGILAYEFDQTNHMETTLATYRFTSNTNNDIDLSESGTAQFIIGELTEGSKITFGKVGANTKTFNIEAPAEIFEGFDPDASGTDQGYIVRQDNFKSIATIYPKITEKSVIEANINRMINNIAEKTEIFSQKAQSDAYKLDLSANAVNSDGQKIVQSDGTHYTINIDAPEYENAVVYVNVDDGGDVIKRAIASTGQFHIQKRSSTVVVMNMESNNSNNYDWQTNTSSEAVSIKKYDVTVNYGDGVTKTIQTDTTHSGNISEHNKDVNKEIAQKIIWSIPNATNVNIDISAGVFLIPRTDADVSVGSSAGWIATGGKAHNHAEWHYIYEGTSEDTNSDTEGQIHFAARKAFTNEYNAKQTIEDMTAFAQKGAYRFHFYETDSSYNTEDANEILKYDNNGDERTITNEETNKIKFPVLTFYANDENVPTGKENYVVSEGSSKTYYYVIKEYNDGEVVDGIYNSDGEIDIKLVVTNSDNVLTYNVNSITYLYSDKTAKSIYKKNTNVDMSGIEFSLGAFFNLENYNYISKRDAVDGEELPGAKLVLTGVDEDGNGIEFSEYVLTKGTDSEILSSEGEELSWISGSEAMLIKGLADGTYTLTEITAPKGYEIAEKVEFTVKNGKITSVSGSDSAQDGKTVIMLDSPKETTSTESTSETTTEKQENSSVTEPTTESTTKATSGSNSQTTTESTSESTTKATSESTSQTTTESTSESASQTTTESTSESTTESHGTPITESTSETTTNSGIETTSEVTSESTTNEISTTETTSDESTESTSETVTETISKESTESTSEETSESTSEESSESTSEESSESTSEESSEETSESTSEESSESTSEETSESTSEESSESNGNGSNGSGSNGNGSNGNGTNGDDSNGNGSNGNGTNGDDSNGSGSNGNGTNGDDSNGNGSNSSGSNGNGTNGDDSNGNGSNGNGSNADDSNGNGSNGNGSSADNSNDNGSDATSSVNDSNSRHGGSSGGSSDSRGNNDSKVVDITTENTTDSINDSEKGNETTTSRNGSTHTGSGSSSKASSSGNSVSNGSAANDSNKSNGLDGANGSNNTNDSNKSNGLNDSSDFDHDDNSSDLDTENGGGNTNGSANGGNSADGNAGNENSVDDSISGGSSSEGSDIGSSSSNNSDSNNNVNNTNSTNENTASGISASTENAHIVTDSSNALNENASISVNTDESSVSAGELPKTGQSNDLSVLFFVLGGLTFIGSELLKRKKRV